MSLNFNPKVTRVLDEIERFGLSHDPVQTDRKQKMLNLERPTAELIHILLVSSGRKRVLEIGTSNGFSAIVIGATLQAIDGAVPLTTIEQDALKVGGARTNIAHANLSFFVQVIQGSATRSGQPIGWTFRLRFLRCRSTKRAGTVADSLTEVGIRCFAAGRQCFVSPARD